MKRKCIILALLLAGPANAQQMPINLLRMTEHHETQTSAKLVRFDQAERRDGASLSWQTPTGAAGRDEYWIPNFSKAKTEGIVANVTVLGYHEQNKILPYRLSKQVVSVNCQRLTWREESSQFYSSDGSTVSKAGQNDWSRIRVGSLAENVMGLVCR